jgi:hypothetical protein
VLPILLVRNSIIAFVARNEVARSPCIFSKVLNSCLLRFIDALVLTPHSVGSAEKRHCDLAT